MGDLVIQETLAFFAAKNPTTGPIVDREFSVQGSMVSITDYSESASGRLALAAADADIAFGMGSVALGKLLFIKTESDVDVKITNALGASQLLRLAAGKQNLMHVEFTALAFTNPSATDPAKLAVYLAGD